MKTELSRLPFSRAGSYMAVSELGEDFRGMSNVLGLYLRTVHGSALKPLAARIIPTAGGRETAYECRMERTSLYLNTDGGTLELCFDDENTLLVRGKGKEIGLILDFLADQGPFDYIYTIPCGGRDYYMANCYKNNCRYLISLLAGKAELEQEWKESSALYSRLYFSGNDGFLFALKEIETEWDRVPAKYDFEECRKRTEDEFLEFARRMPSCPEQYREAAERAAYLNWSGIVKKDGFLKRDAMFMSKNWMCNVWSWDHCFNAIALSYHNPELAWDQFMIMFDHQDVTGLIPDSVNDVHIVWNYCKPPIHGWALRRMMEHMELSKEQMQEAYQCLGKWTDWWLVYRDYNGDGLCEYNHGNDSGWDNSTAFSALPPVTTPELQAFLVIQMEVLAELADRLGIDFGREAWSRKSAELYAHFLEKCFVDGLPVIRRSVSGEVIENNSLLPYVSIVLGRRLPEEIRKKMTEILIGDRFYTDYGFATESPGSTEYRADGYWRGPIWAPSTMLVLDGLYQCGEEEFVREAARRFADMAVCSGFAENFDALTGEGLRDRAYTWTSSVFLILVHEYLTEKGEGR